METRVGLGDRKERTREAEERPFAPQKLIRTAGLPFLSSCTSGDGSSVPTSTPSLISGPTLFPNDDYDGGRAFQPFPTPFKSQGVGVGVGGCDLRGFPFTSAQWQELQRQALIYKHIISSVPIPPDLLFSNSPPHHLLPNLVAGRGGGGTFNLRFSNRMDPEPWRCRRTDGKKWRCKRNAAPDQKYCERHMHRGRPRSRKPVEVSNAKRASTNAPPTTAVSTNSPTIVTTTTTTTTTSLSKPLPSQSSGLFLKDELKIPFQSLEPNKEPRCLDWMKGNDEEMESSLQWELMHSKIGLRHGTIPVLQYYENQLTLNYSAFLNPDLCSLEYNAVGNRGEAPRSFIDAWSTENPSATAEVGNSTSVPTTGELPPSTLTLSMSSTGEATDHQIQMAPVSPLGGPLGEVLQASSATSTPRQGFGADGGDSTTGGLINILSHGFHGCHEVSPQESPTRLASSPSVVLQKALVSLSDSSNSSSPTFVAASRSEIALQWINQTKQ